MKNKMATECWNILRGELDSAIDKYVPMKKQGKQSKKKHLSKEAFKKIRYKQSGYPLHHQHSSEHNLSQLPTTLHTLAAPSPVVTAVSTTSTAA